MIDRESKLPRIGVAAVVFGLDRKLLLVRRDTPPAKGLWTIPGGKQEAGETLVEACIREVLEETGLAVTLGPVVAVVERRQDEFHYVIIDFLASPENGLSTVGPAGDVSEARWVEPGELCEYDLVEGLEHIIRISRGLRFDKANGGLRKAGQNRFDFVAELCPGP